MTGKYWDCIPEVCRYCANENTKVCDECEFVNYNRPFCQFDPKCCGNCGMDTDAIGCPYINNRKDDDYCSKWEPKEADNED